MAVDNKLVKEVAALVAKDLAVELKKITGRLDAIEKQVDGLQAAADKKDELRRQQIADLQKSSLAATKDLSSVDLIALKKQAKETEAIAARQRADIAKVEADLASAQKDVLAQTKAMQDAVKVMIDKQVFESRLTQLDKRINDVMALALSARR